VLITLLLIIEKKPFEGITDLPEVKSLTDAEIMLKIAGYDSKALELLYDRYTPLLYTLIKRIIPDKETAEEVLSEIFVIIWRQIDQIDFKSSNVYTWMVTLARNKAIDVKNRNIGKVTEEYTVDYEKEKILPKLSREIESVELEDVLGMKEKIEGAIKSLTDAQRYVMELSYYEGVDEIGIAEKLKIPSSTVKSKLQVAIGNLMKKISKPN
jgi:RNA polymerase sigma-70 factor (ECF subfamily)